jgi:predicted phosphoribosyltransferase
VQAAFQVAEQHGHSLDTLFVRQIFQPLLTDLVSRNAILAQLFRLQIQLFQFVVRQRKKVPQFVGQCISF